MDDSKEDLGRGEEPAVEPGAEPAPGGPKPASFAVTSGLWLVCALLLIRFVFAMPGVLSAPYGEFVAYFVSAQEVVDGRGAAHFYDDDRFRKEIHRRGYQGNDIYSPNPPTTSLLMIPLTGMDFRPARHLWTMIGLVLVLVSSVVIVRELKLGGPALPAFVAAVLFSQPLHADLRHGQVYSLILFLLVGTWFAWRRQRQILGGVSLALMIASKIFGGPLWILLGWNRWWRSLAAGAAILAALIVVSLPLVTPSAWLEFAEMARGIPGEPTLAVTAFQSVGGFVSHLFAAHPIWNPDPIIDAPRLAKILAWSLPLVLMLGSLRISSTTAHRDLSFAIFAVLSVIGSPYAQDYTYTLTLLPMGILLAHPRLSRSRVDLLLVILGIMLISAPLPFKAPVLAKGIAALLAYPKLYGGLVIWAVLVRFASDRPD